MCQLRKLASTPLLKNMEEGMNDNFNLEKRMFNSSSIADYMGCPRLFYWGCVRKLELREQKASISFGSAFHEALLVWYRTGNREEALKKFEVLPLVIEDDHRTRGWGEAIFKQYVEKYKMESGETLHLEVKFRVEIGERIYAGTMDRIEKWEGQIYVGDHKTTKMLGLSFFESYRPSPQIDGYCWATRELVGRCAGAIINGISVANNPKERFQRYISSRSNEEMDNWKEVFTDTTEDMERDVERKHFPMRTTYCNRWGKCKFWELCVYYQKDEVMREKFIEAQFKVKEEVKNEERKD